MSSKILIIYEGKKTEKQIINRIKNDFLSNPHISFFPYKTTIYDLWGKLMEEDDDDITLLSVLKQKDPVTFNNKINRHTFSEVYLFFDYDGHASKASDDDLKKMIKYFDDEFDKGKLYISYPMVEAFRHLTRGQKECESNCCVAAKEKIGYKNIIHNYSNDYTYMNSMTLEHWKEIFIHNYSKANCLLFDEYEIPEDVLECTQKEIFSNQLEKFIKRGSIGVLSGFPFL